MKKSKKQTAKSKRPSITIRALKGPKIGSVQFYSAGDSTFALLRPGQNRKASKGLITTVKTTILSGLFFDKKETPAVHADVTLAQLESFMRKLRADVKRFRALDKKARLRRVCVRHLGPDLSLAVEY